MKRSTPGMSGENAREGARWMMIPGYKNPVDPDCN